MKADGADVDSADRWPGGGSGRIASGLVLLSEPCIYRHLIFFCCGVVTCEDSLERNDGTFSSGELTCCIELEGYL